MNCKNCRHWFVNPNIVIPGEPTEGKCLVSEIKTQSNQVCNGWELSRIAELEAEIERFTAHDAIERQDDKSPNDTQSQTIVYGKEDSEDK